MSIRTESSVPYDPGDRHLPIVFDKKASWEQVRLRHCRVRPGEALHQGHAEDHIFIPLEGSFCSEVPSAAGGKRTVCGITGNTSIIPAGLGYSAHWEDDLEHLSIFLNPQLLARMAGEMFRSERIELVDTCGADDPLIRHIGLALLAEIGSEGSPARLYVDSLVNTLAIHLLKSYATVDRKWKSFSGGLAGYRLRRATEFIEESLADDLSLAEIAQAADLSPFHFARAFKQSTGLTPLRYLMERRIQRAKHLLAETELPIVEVSYKVGFKSQSHFTTIFRRLTASTPRAYRKAVL
jgi:AraC family transcriptional regulator